MSAQKVRINNALIDLIKGATYLAITNDPVTGHATLGGAVEPASAFTNEISNQFEEDSNYGRGRRPLLSTSWLWLVIVRFNQEVSSDTAEEAWKLKPLVLPATATQRQAVAYIKSADYQHPTKQQSHNGSLIQFTFEVRQHRR